LVRHGCDVNERCTDTSSPDVSPLHAAVILNYDRVKYTRWLLKNGAWPNSRNSQDDTPLHLVCALPRHDCAEIIEMLEAVPSLTNKVCVYPIDICFID
jgi:ankyrin repeat protein